MVTLPLIGAELSGKDRCLLTEGSKNSDAGLTCALLNKYMRLRAVITHFNTTVPVYTLVATSRLSAEMKLIQV
jgi:hypothetical protein